MVAAHRRRDLDTVARMPGQSNPDWMWDEEILTFDLYREIGAAGREDTKVKALSDLLRSLDLHPIASRSPTFRNPNGVARKLGDTHSHRPGYAGKPTRGSRIDSEIWELYGYQPDKVHALADAIRRGSGVVLPVEEDEDEIERIHHEGRISYRLHRRYERDPRLRVRKRAQVIKLRGKLTCEACDAGLEAAYGPVGNAIFECHHLIPLATSGPIESTVSSVALLCPTGHRAAHRIEPWPSIAAMRALREPHQVGLGFHPSDSENRTSVRSAPAASWISPSSFQRCSDTSVVPSQFA